MSEPVFTKNFRHDHLARFTLMCCVGAFVPASSAVALDLSGIEIEGGVSAVIQRVNAVGVLDSSGARTKLGYRGDVSATIPMRPIGSAENRFVAHIRFGQGEGVATVPTNTGSVNSLAFDSREPGSNATAILAQFYYQLQFGGDAANRYSLSVGKLDPFGFFDQNAVADDESAAFLNNVFLHNPMLDSGGDIGGDEYGFTPGLVGSWASHDSAGPRIGIDAGLFAAGKGADFSGSPSRPLSLLQLSFSPLRSQNKATGTWRLYGWYNPQAGEPAQAEPAHAGWGVSIDHKLTGTVTAFGRLGKRIRGTGSFQSAITGGIAVDGSTWSRQTDTLGLAVGRLRSDDATSGNGDETVFELFYRVAFGESIAVTPHWQVIQSPAGDDEAPDVRVIGVRASIAF